MDAIKKTCYTFIMKLLIAKKKVKGNQQTHGNFWFWKLSYCSISTSLKYVLWDGLAYNMAIDFSLTLKLSSYFLNHLLPSTGFVLPFLILVITVPTTNNIENIFIFFI